MGSGLYVFLGMDSMGISLPCSPMDDMTQLPHFSTRRKTEIMMELDSKCHYALGRDGMLNRVFELYHRALIDHLEYCSMNRDEWVA